MDPLLLRFQPSLPLALLLALMPLPSVLSLPQRSVQAFLRHPFLHLLTFHLNPSYLWSLHSPLVLPPPQKLLLQ